MRFNGSCMTDDRSTCIKVVLGHVYAVKKCPYNMVYLESGSPCLNTCTNTDTKSLCDEHSVDGCFCPEGQCLCQMGPESLSMGTEVVKRISRLVSSFTKEFQLPFCKTIHPGRSYWPMLVCHIKHLRRCPSFMAHRFDLVPSLRDGAGRHLGQGLHTAGSVPVLPPEAL